MLTKAVHRHYTNAFPTPRRREATWVFARDLLGASRWYEQLWSRRDRIAEKPALLLWGLKDPAFAGQLPRWRTAFTNARVVTYPDAGHFVPEEVEGVGATVEDFLANYEPGA